LDQFQDLQGGFGLIVRPTDFGGDRRQSDRAQDSSEQQGRPRRFPLEHFLNLLQALAYPLNGWSFEDLVDGGL
jgi:hypothetical protein